MAKDLFSRQAATYARYRPVYPRALYDHLVSLVAQHNTAWDCATGNGQAALELTRYFDKVFATDISEKQLEQATPHEKITYFVAPADASGIPANSIDLITVAQAYHWFDFEAFHREVVRVAKPDALIAVWGYSLIQSEYADLNTLIHDFYRGKTGPYWDAERKYVDEAYTTVAFPYKEVTTPALRIEVQWTKEDLLGYFNTWSSVQHFIKANGYNPVDELITTLPAIWPEAESRAFYFPLFMRVGRVH